MTNEQAKKLLTAEQLETARTEGKEWGYAEADLWRDQNPDRELPEWSMGTYCGKIDIADEQAHEAYELVLENAARDEWNRYRESLVA